MVLDLASPDSVRAAAKDINAYTEHLDILINNAAIMHTPKREPVISSVAHLDFKLKGCLFSPSINQQSRN